MVRIIVAILYSMIYFPNDPGLIVHDFSMLVIKRKDLPLESIILYYLYIIITYLVIK